MLPDLFALRHGTSADQDIIEASWIDTMRHASPHTRGIPSDVFKPHQRQVIRRLVPRCAVLIACLKDDPEVVLGYCVHELRDDRPVVHFVYVKERFRGAGIATALVASATRGRPFSASHYTDALWSLLHRIPTLPVTVNPYLAE